MTFCTDWNGCTVFRLFFYWRMMDPSYLWNKRDSKDVVCDSVGLFQLFQHFRFCRFNGRSSFFKSQTGSSLPLRCLHWGGSTSLRDCSTTRGHCLHVMSFSQSGGENVRPDFFFFFPSPEQLVKYHESLLRSRDETIRHSSFSPAGFDWQVFFFPPSQWV